MSVRAGLMLLAVLLAGGCGGQPSDKSSDAIARWAIPMGGKVTLAGKARELERLDQLPKPPYSIERLVLNNTKVTDDDLLNRDLASLPNLKYLGLHSTEISDDGMDALLKLPVLSELELSNTQITDTGLTKLGDMRQLKVLYLHNNAISADAIGRLQERLPGCKIYH